MLGLRTNIGRLIASARRYQPCDLDGKVMCPQDFLVACIRLSRLGIPFLQLRNAVFEEDLRVGAHEFPFGIDFIDCIFKGGVEFFGTRLRFLQFYGCTVGARSQVAKDTEKRFIIRSCKIDGDLRMTSAQRYLGRADWFRYNVPEFSGKFECDAAVELTSTTVDGHLDCSGAHFKHCGRHGFFAFGVQVRGSVFLRDNFEADGGVWINDAVIEKTVRLEGGKFNYEGAECLYLKGTKVGSDIIFYAKRYNEQGIDMTLIKGKIFLTDVNVNGNIIAEGLEKKYLEFRGGLFADGIRIDRNFELNRVSCDYISMKGAKIGGSLHVCKCNLGSIYLNSSVIERDFVFNPDEVTGNIYLENMRCYEYDDRWCFTGVSQTSNKIYSYVKHRLFEIGIKVKIARNTDEEKWKKYYLSGMSCQIVGEQISNVAHNSFYNVVYWLYYSDGVSYNPQPYELFSFVFKQQGYDNASREMIIAKRVEQRRIKNSSRSFAIALLLGLADYLLVDLTVRYGYRPWRPLILGAIFCLLAGWYFQSHIHLFVPAEGDVLTYALQSQKNNDSILLYNVPSEYAKLNPYLYALDIFLPLVDLNQERYWHPMGNLEWSKRHESHDSKKHSKEGYNFLVDSSTVCWIIIWVLVLSGWYLTTLFVSAFTGILRLIN